MTQFLESNEGTVTAIVSIVVAVSVLTTALVKIWPFLTKLVTMVNGFVGYHGEPGLLDRVKTLEHNSVHEKRNHDKMSEQLDRVETQVHIMTDRFDRFSHESANDRQRLWALARKHHQGEVEE